MSENERTTIENGIYEEIFEEERVIKQLENSIKKIKSDTTTLDKTKRLSNRYEEIIKRQNTKSRLERQLGSYFSKQRLTLARVIIESVPTEGLDLKTAELISSLMNENVSRGSKTKTRKHRKPRKPKKTKRRKKR
tara:strand:+ start:112 stop:516 length:405 start_codon:yes stop_codon:yes gene_type:complete